jgi:hypothetical protein
MRPQANWQASSVWREWINFLAQSQSFVAKLPPWLIILAMAFKWRYMIVFVHEHHKLMKKATTKSSFSVCK